MKRKIIGIAMIVMLVICFRIGYMNANKEYQKGTHIMGSMFEWKQIEDKGELCITEFERLDNEASKRIMESIGGGPDFPYRVYLVKISFANLLKEELDITVSNFYIETLGWANGIMQELYFQYNKETSMKLSLQEGEKREVVLPYLILSNAFQRKEWENVDNRKFAIVHTQYPVKRMIHLSGNDVQKQ